VVLNRFPTPSFFELLSLMTKTYHHGDLRSALIDSGLKLLKDRNGRDGGKSKGEDLGLREVARDVGVSATAIYRHFPDKGALMLALAHEGIERLGLAQRQATEAAGGGPAGFLASGMTYVRFAADNPALFRLIFSHVPATSLLDAELDDVGIAMRGLREDIAVLMPSHLGDLERKAAALHAWALVHGLAQLILDGHVGRDWGMIEKVLSGMLVREPRN
jgi:AcrR family transcriptional regulator